MIPRCWLRVAVVWALAAVPAVAQPPAVVFQASARGTTLGEQVSKAAAIFVLRVGEVDPETGIITFRRVETLKGEPTAKTYHHEASSWLGEEDRAGLLAWARPGKLAVCFQEDSGDCNVCLGNFWYQARPHDDSPWSTWGGVSWYAEASVGPVEKLRDAVVAIRAGKEVTVAARVPFGQPDGPVPLDWLHGRKGPTWRVKASRDLTDSRIIDEESPYFVGWGVGGKESVPALVAALKDHDANVRAEAAEDLASLGPLAGPAVEALREGLRDTDPFARVSVAAALLHADPEAGDGLAVLVKALGDKEAGARTAAATALAGAGKQAAPASRELRRALREDAAAPVRRAAAFALGRLVLDGSPDDQERKKTVAALAAAVRLDPDRDVRCWAVRALRKFGPDAKAALPELRRAVLQDEDSVPAAAADVLARLGTDGVPALVEAVQARGRGRGLTGRVVDCVGDLGPAAREAVPALRDLLGDEDRDVRLAAALALQRVGARADAEAAARAYGQLLNDEGAGFTALSRVGRMGPSGRAALPGLRAAVSEKKVLAWSWVPWMIGEVGGDPEAVPALRELLDERNYRIRAGAAFALARSGGRREALAVLVRMLRSEDDDARERAAEALRELGPDAAPAVPDLRKVLSAGKDAYTRAEAAAALWHVQRREELELLVHDPRQEALIPLIAMLRADDPRERSAAVTRLVDLGPDARRAAPGLAAVLRDPDVAVRLSAAEALCRMGPAAGSAAGALTDALKDECRSVRIAAAAALAHVRLRSPEAVAELTGLLERHPDEAPAIAAALAEFGPEAKPAVPLLLRCLVDDDRSVYLAAARALLRIHPEAARKAGLP
jgi:HEAT repeat protein